MSTQTSPPEPRRLTTRLRGRLSRLEIRQLTSLVGGLALAGTAAFGGLDTVTDPVKHFDVGQQIDDGEFTLTVKKISRRTEIVGAKRIMFPADPEHVYLGVLATIGCNGTVTGSLVPAPRSGVLELRNHPDQDFRGTYRARDGSPITSLGPGLTEDVAFIWKLPAQALPPGAQVTLRAWDKQFRDLNLFYGRAWLPRDTYSELTATVATA